MHLLMLLFGRYSFTIPAETDGRCKRYTAILQSSLTTIKSSHGTRHFCCCSEVPYQQDSLPIHCYLPVPTRVGLILRLPLYEMVLLCGGSAVFPETQKGGTLAQTNRIIAIWYWHGGRYVLHKDDGLTRLQSIRKRKTNSCHCM